MYPYFCKVEADDMFIITTEPTDLYEVKEAVNTLGFTCDEASLEMIPKTTVESDVETAKANLALITWLEELDDVDAVYHNMIVPEELQE